LHVALQVEPIVDFHTSACNGAVDSVWLARLHQYREFAWSLSIQSSPLVVSAGWISVQLVPESVDLYIGGEPA
jgi:hypothetical protein